MSVQDALNSEKTMREYHIEMKRFADKRNSKKVLHLLGQMHLQGLNPGVITYNTAMCACNRAKKYQTTLTLLAELQLRGIEPDQITYNAAVWACFKLQFIDQATDLLKEMLQMVLID